jgi:gas vesicle protein
VTDTRHGYTGEPRIGTASGHRASFLKGLFGGVLIGTAAGVLFAPQIYAALGNLRRQLADATAEASDVAAQKYRETTARVGDAVDDLEQKGRGVYGKTLSVIARGAEEVRERATEAQVQLGQSAATAARRQS